MRLDKKKLLYVYANKKAILPRCLDSVTSFVSKNEISSLHEVSIANPACLPGRKSRR